MLCEDDPPPLQGCGMSSGGRSPRASLRFALGYHIVAPFGAAREPGAGPPGDVCQTCNTGALSLKGDGVAGSSGGPQGQVYDSPGRSEAQP